MLKSRNTQETPKRAKPAIRIHEASPLTEKRTRSLPAAVETICLVLPENTPKESLLTQNLSRTRKRGGKPSQREYSRYQNGSPKEVISRFKGKVFGFPEVEQSSKKGAWRNDKYRLGNGVTPELHSASTSSSSAHQEQEFSPLEARCAKLSICSDDTDSIFIYDGDMWSPEKAMSEDSQMVEMTESLLPEVVPDDPQGVEPLLPELTDDIIGRLPMLDVLQLRSELGKAFKDAILRPAFLRNRPSSEGEYSPIFFMTDEQGDLHLHGFDTKLRIWTRLPSLNFAKMILPSPDPDLFKDYLVAGDWGLLCLNVGKATGREKLVVCNPLTQQVKVLPPLKFPRHPVLMHLKVDHDSGHYKVIVAGSAAIGTEALSVKTEEYDSREGEWECPDGSDLPCPPFGLNEYQNGAYYKDAGRELLMCIAIVDTKGRGVLVYDITKKKWVQGPLEKQLHIPLVRSEGNVSHLATTQIVEFGGSVFVFSEQECGRDVYFLVHKLIPEDFTWDEVMKRKRTGGRGLLVYPEFTCVPVSEHELCIFNTVEHTTEIIDVVNSVAVEILQSYSSPRIKGNRFHSLNPIGFVFKPSFKSVVCPRRRTPFLQHLGTVPSKVSSNATQTLVKPVTGPISLPVPIRYGRHRSCARNAEEAESRPRSWPDNGVVVQYPVEAKLQHVGTVPTNETDATGTLVKAVTRPISLPVQICYSRHRPCGRDGEEAESHPRSWDDDGVIMQYPEEAKLQHVGTVPTNEADATGTLVKPVSRPISIPVQNRDMRHRPCGMHNEEDGRPRSWDDDGVNVPRPVAAK